VAPSSCSIAGAWGWSCRLLASCTGRDQPSTTLGRQRPCGHSHVRICGQLVGHGINTKRNLPPAAHIVCVAVKGQRTAQGGESVRRSSAAKAKTPVDAARGGLNAGMDSSAPSRSLLMPLLMLFNKLSRWAQSTGEGRWNTDTRFRRRLAADPCHGTEADRANVLCHAGPESTGSRRLLWQSMCTACVRCVVATLVRGGPHNHAAAAATCRHTGGASKVDSLPPHHSWITPTYYPGRLPVFCVKLRIIVVELRVIRIAAAVHEWCACKPSTTNVVLCCARWSTTGPNRAHSRVCCGSGVC